MPRDQKMARARTHQIIFSVHVCKKYFLLLFPFTFVDMNVVTVFYG
jgi:hypothetical protein